MIKVTPKHFKEYQQAVRYWLDFWGLKDWRVLFRQEPNKHNAAWVVIDHDSHQLSLGLTTEMDAVDFDMDYQAFHEVAHILLEPVVSQTNNNELVCEQEHRIIRVLENTVFPNQRRGK